MPKVDARDCPVTGASPAALDHFERALAAFQLCRGDLLVHLRDAIAEAPEFAMARIVEAYLRLGGRDRSLPVQRSRQPSTQPITLTRIAQRRRA